MEDISEKNEEIGMSAYHLKIFAIIAMLIDHIAWTFLPSDTIIAQIMHIIGRITAPIMAYFISEGYHHSKNIKKYALRLAVFAIISHFPYYYYINGTFSFFPTDNNQIRYQTSVIYTLFLGLLSIIVWENTTISKNIKIAIIILICIISIPGDWNFIIVLWVLFFSINHDNFEDQITSFSRISIPIMFLPIIAFIGGQDNWFNQLFHIGIPLAIPLLKQYNGKIGGYKHSKWLFYIFYPLHLVILGLIKYKLL